MRRRCVSRRVNPMRDDDRGVSVTVGYVLNFAVAALLISGLLIAAGGLIDSQTDQVTRDELSVIGHQLADDLSSADRLARAGNTSEFSLRSDLPRRTAAGGYTVEIDPEPNSDRGTIELRTSSPEVIVRVPFRVNTTIAGGSVTGAPVRIEYDPTEDRLAVVSA